MKITIINSETKENEKIILVSEKILKILSDKNEVEIINLRDLKIKYCKGKFLCWTKNPGLCALKDDTNYLNNIYINSDFVLFISPVRYGLVSSLLKTMLDKLLPLLSVDFEYKDGVARHKRRYSKYPKIGFLFEFPYENYEKDLQIISNLMIEASKSIFATPIFIKNLDVISPKEVCNEIINY